MGLNGPLCSDRIHKINKDEKRARPNVAQLIRLQDPTFETELLAFSVAEKRSDKIGSYSAGICPALGRTVVASPPS